MGMMDIRSFIQYLKFEKRYSPNTIEAYENDLLQFSEFLKQTYETEDLKDLRHTHVRAWLAQLLENQITARSANRKLSSLKSFIKFEMKNSRLEKIRWRK